jgi:hypothetical protein
MSIFDHVATRTNLLDQRYGEWERMKVWPFSILPLGRPYKRLFVLTNPTRHESSIYPDARSCDALSN